MTFSDERLMAFADGELEREERAAIEAAMASDPTIAARVEHFRAQRELLRRSFDAQLHEPVPQRLLDTALTAPMGAANIVGLQDARVARSTANPRTWSWPHWTAMAASLLVGLLVGQSMRAPRDGASLVAAHDGGLVARGDLDAALTGQAAGELAPIAIGFTYRAKSGEYCRTFTVTRGTALAGIACREGGEWDVRVLSQVDASTSAAGEYRMAGAVLPPLVLQAVEAQIAGEPLDAAAESAARRTEWRE
jgi:hypothetical protein